MAYEKKTPEKSDSDLQKLLKGYAKEDLPKFRKRLRDIALGKVKDSQYDPKSGKVVPKDVALSVCVDAINSYTKVVLGKVIADVKGEQNLNVNYGLTDAVKEVAAKKRAEYEKKAEKERAAKEAGILARKAIGS